MKWKSLSRSDDSNNLQNKNNKNNVGGAWRPISGSKKTEDYTTSNLRETAETPGSVPEGAAEQL